MDQIFQTGVNQKHIIYSIDEHIMARRIQADAVSRPSYLANDFSHSLSSTIYNNIIYYSYISTEGVLNLRHIYSSTPLFRLGADASCRYEDVFITTFNNHLILFYCINDLTSPTWDVMYIPSPETVNPAEPVSNHNPAGHSELAFEHYSSVTSKPLSTHYPTESDESFSKHIMKGLTHLPHISIFNTEAHLILSIQCADEKHLLELSSDMSIISHDGINDNMEQQSKRHLEKINELQGDIDSLQNASSLMMNKISSLLEENEQLKNDHSDLKERNSSCTHMLSEKEEEIQKLSASLNETKKALTIREAQIESAAKQYNELMEVASRYRDEAAKWRMKLAVRNQS